MTAQSIMRLDPFTTRRNRQWGRILFAGVDLLSLSEKKLNAIRGNRIS
jgi:ABC-type microcin C transport system duplicated ATPase subunit YejF